MAAPLDFRMLMFLFRHPLIVAIGFALIVLSVYLAWRKHHELLTGHLAQGEVTELIPHRGSKGGTNYTLRVAYTRADGVATEFVTRVASSPPLHQYGEKVRVVYYSGSDQPDILAFADLYLFPWILFCAGVVTLMMCAGFGLGPGLIDSIYLPHYAPSDPLQPLIK